MSILYFLELTGENTEVDWTNVLKLSMKEAEKCVLPLAVFKVMKLVYMA